MAKPNIARTFGQIHFEDLDPHRFEDLVRELIYDYKDWQSIEATGRSGSDDGFDIRAFEKVSTYYSEIDEEDVERNEKPHPMDGNLWMIQCKRENEIGPQKVSNIIKEGVKPESLPYGYILVASANFSKKSYDVFREDLKKKGVMEFYLWGKAELEDMLHMPKYDRILFTFFGFSLISKKRSKSTEVRSHVTVKNKLYKILGEEGTHHKQVLIRDINDTLYPYQKEYLDFDSKPRWGKYFFKGNHVHGLMIELNKYYGYYDSAKNEWDMTSSLDLNKLYEEGETNEEAQLKLQKNALYREYWTSLPKAKQVEISKWGLLEYADIAIVDEKGDPVNKMVHIYADYKYEFGPFSRIIHVTDKQTVLENNESSRIAIFPETIPQLKPGKMHKKQFIILNGDHFKLLDNPDHGINALYDTKDKYFFLNLRDTIEIRNERKQEQKIWIKITCKYDTKIKDYKEDHKHLNAQYFIRSQLGNEFSEEDFIKVFEFITTYEQF